MEGEIAGSSNTNIQKLLRTAITVHEEYDFYIPPVFAEFNTISTGFESDFHILANKKRELYLEYLKTSEPDDAYEKAAHNALSEFIEMQRQQ